MNRTTRPPHSENSGEAHAGLLVLLLLAGFAVCAFLFFQSRSDAPVPAVPPTESALTPTPTTPLVEFAPTAVPPEGTAEPSPRPLPDPAIEVARVQARIEAVIAVERARPLAFRRDFGGAAKTLDVWLAAHPVHPARALVGQQVARWRAAEAVLPALFAQPKALVGATLSIGHAPWLVTGVDHGRLVCRVPSQFGTVERPVEVSALSDPVLVPLLQRVDAAAQTSLAPAYLIGLGKNAEALAVLRGEDPAAETWRASVEECQQICDDGALLADLEAVEKLLAVPDLGRAAQRFEACENAHPGHEFLTIAYAAKISDWRPRLAARPAAAPITPVPAFAARPLPASVGRPNIILCMADDQGWGDVGYNGLSRNVTPALDAMAAASLRFNRFYAQQACSPTRAAVMTGRHPNRMGCHWPGMPLRKQEYTVAQAAKTAGYVTGHFGKWHLNGVAGFGKQIPDTDPLSPRNVGFDESFSVTNWFDLNWTFSHNGNPQTATGDGSEAIVAQALKFIGQTAPQKKPFFLCVWFGSPHQPHQPLPADLTTAGGSPYYGELVALDRSMGTLRAGLRELGVADNTIVWYCSDNGSWSDRAAPTDDGTNGPLRGRKGDMWEGGIRVPGLLEWPARIKPGVTDIPAGVVDMYPTLVEIMGAKVAHQIKPLDGISLVPLLAGKMKVRPQPLGFWHGRAAWSDNRYKLIKASAEKFELYDLIADPGESTDLASKHPGIVRSMKNDLEKWQESVLKSDHGEDYPGNKIVPPKKAKG